MQGQNGGAPMWSVAVHWVPRFWGYPGGAGQGQLSLVFFPGPPCMSYKAIRDGCYCAVIGDSQAKPSCESRLLFLVQGLRPLSKRYGGWGLTEAGCSCLTGFRKFKA